MFKTTIAAIAAASILAGLAPASAADRYDRRVVIINDTGVEMREFYASNVGTYSWQEDILGRYTLPAGQSFTANIDDGTGYCMYDFKAVFSDGDVLIRNRVNVCEISSYRYY